MPKAIPSPMAAFLAPRVPAPRRVIDELDPVVAVAPGTQPAASTTPSTIAGSHSSGQTGGGKPPPRPPPPAASARLVRRAGDGVRHVHGAGRYPDRHQLADPNTRRSVGQPGRDQLGADLVSDCRSGDDPALRHLEPARSVW